MKKNIAFLINSLTTGGAERVVSRLSFLLKNKYNVYIILMDGEEVKYPYAGEIIDLQCKEKKNRIEYAREMLSLIPRIRKISKEKEISVIISFLDVPNIINVLTTKSAKTVISIRNYMKFHKYQNWSERMKYYICRLVYRRADEVIVLSKLEEAELIKDFGVNQEKIKIIANPYNMDEIQQLKEEKIDRSEENFYDNHDVVIAVGRLIGKKGYPYLLEAFEKVVESHSNAGLLIIGEGKERKKLEKMIEEKKLETNIKLAGEKKNPFAYVGKAQIYVSASMSEGFPNALVEAMSCGIPVISTDCKTGPREILYYNPDLTQSTDCIERADFGILVPDFFEYKESEEKKRFAVEKMSEAICMLLEREKLRKVLGEKAKIRANEYSSEKCIEKYVQIIEE